MGRFKGGAMTCQAAVMQPSGSRRLGEGRLLRVLRLPFRVPGRGGAERSPMQGWAALAGYETIRDPGKPEQAMDIVKLGKKGQVSLPAGVLRKLGLQGESATLTVEATEDGAVVLRPAAVYPVEIYSGERLKEFEEANRLSSKEAARVAKALKRRRR
jgi:AbrB family looped-hinge helix DNA binding protein